MDTAVPADRTAISAPVPPMALDVFPTDEMTEAARVAIAARLPAFEQLPSLEQFRIAHMALAAGLSAQRSWRITRVFPVVVLLLLLAACGRKPTAPVERVCWTEELKLPVLNAVGDTVRFDIVRTRRCTGS